MYEPTNPLNLHRLSRQSLQKRYESDEEDVSESEAGAQDFVPSLVGSQRAGTFDSDLSADENSHADPDSDREEQLLSPYSSAKRPRPVSMDTVKRNSNANFGDDAYVFDPEEDMVLELPSPDSPPMASSLYLQPTIYVRPNSPPAISNPRSRSPSPSSIFSVESAEIQTAKKVTLMEPTTRPTVVFINAIGARSKASRSRPSHSRSRATSRDRGSRMFPDRTESSLDVPLLAENPRPSKTHGEREEQESSNFAMLQAATPSMQSATINRVSEIPVLPYITPSPQIRPQSMYRSRPRTAGCEKSFPAPPNPSRTRRPTDLGHRPASVRKNSNSSVPSYSRPASPFPDEIRPGYIADHSETASLHSNPYTCSPASSPRPPSHFSKRSMSNMLAQKSPMMRRMTRKHSATSSIASVASLHSEMDAPAPIPAAMSQPSLTSMNYESHMVRKPSQRHGRHNSSAFGGRGFMGLKLGKRSFTKA
jgi:hypothetical protein